MLRPALKGTVPYFTAEGSVHFRCSGELTSFDDPDGRVRRLLELLDGRHGLTDVHRKLTADYPDLTADDVQQAVEELDAERLVQDASDTGADFTAEERERWSRNLGFFEMYATLERSKFQPQRDIRDAKVGVLGVGGIGSHILLDLVAVGFTDIRILDYDTIELSNLNRQVLYGEDVIGRPKVTVAAERAAALNSAVRIDAVDARITSADVVHDVVRDRDVVIVAVDKPKTEILHWVNAGCIRAGTPFFIGAVEGVRAFHYGVVPGLSGCLECWQSDVRERDATAAMVFDVLDEAAAAGQRFGEDMAAFDGLVAPLVGHLLSELVRFVTGIEPPLSVGRMLTMSFADPRLTEGESWLRRTDCATCAATVRRSDVRWAPEAEKILPF